MSKIDAYNKIKSENSSAIGQLNEVLGNKTNGEPNPDNDKHGADFYDHSIWDSDTKLYLHMSYGYYGSSSGYAVSSDVIKKYIIKVLNSKCKETVKEAMELMKKAIEIARLDSVNEAKQILKEIDA